MNVDSAEGEGVSGVCTTGCSPVMTVVVYADVGVPRRQRLGTSFRGIAEHVACLCDTQAISHIPRSRRHRKNDHTNATYEFPRLLHNGAAVDFSGGR